MVSSLRLPTSGLETTRLAFGTSRLHYVAGKERQRLLATAVDLGIRHIDTAPVYGDELAESEIGRFIRGRRSDVVLATKYGIPPDRVIAAMPVVSSPLRAARAAMRQFGYWQMHQPELTSEGLRLSTEGSLRRLDTDVIDVLFLHEPIAKRIPSVDDLLDELTKLRQRGLIRHFGLSGAWAGIASLGPLAQSTACILQTAENEWPDGEPPDITYGALSHKPQSAFGTSLETLKVFDRLRSALARRPNGAVIVSTTSCKHLHELALVAAEPAQ